MMETTEQRYIAVEGVIGVGKTTFATMLADRLNAELMLENGYDNPFLNDFYKDRKRYALSCQLYFLISRFQQQQQLIGRDLFRHHVVTDYLFARDSVFASVTLNERELALYERIAPHLQRDIPRPDLVIYLQATTPRLLSRVKKRNLALEKSIDSDYLDALNKAYDYFFFHYSETPLLVIKTDEIDFVSEPRHFDDLVSIVSRPVAGRRYYTPPGIDQ